MQGLDVCVDILFMKQIIARLYKVFLEDIDLLELDVNTSVSGGKQRIDFKLYVQIKGTLPKAQGWKKLVTSDRVWNNQYIEETN